MKNFLLFIFLFIGFNAYSQSPCGYNLCVVIFNEGEEVERFSPNIMFQTDATKDEIQEAIDEEVMSDF
jgi:hypothetical protein